MVEVAFPSVVDALFDLAVPTLPTVRVSDGYDISGDPGDVLLLGVPNLGDESAISAGNFTQEQMGHGSAGVIRETGSLNGVVMAWVGEATNDGAKAARASAFGYLATLSAAVRADRSLGVTDFDLVVQTITATGDIAEDKVDGATCAISFTVNYIALIEH